MGTESRTRLAVLTAGALIVAAFGMWQGWRSGTVDPDAPPSVCSRMRSEVFDILVPGHGPLAAGEQSRPARRSNHCLAEDAFPQAGTGASLGVALTHFGRYEVRGPHCLDRDGLLIILNRVAHTVDLGDLTVYYLSGAILIAAGTLGWYAGRMLAAPVVRWQITVIDEAGDRPPLPQLPRSPFTR
ncbi:hypothetical protein GCM10027290_39930 [Micromonospora sonneratiae]|uniref:PepSY-associated TM region n=1 Tax=Micromonospora sonneratiae TaxID=1184706 RepID=A0ABW3YET0_9ACTN